MNLDELNSLSRRVATEVMGWELLTVGYYGQTTAPHAETPRQVELSEWLHFVDIDSVGDFFIDVEECFWVEVEKWSPATSIAHAFEVRDKIKTMEKGVQAAFCDKLLELVGDEELIFALSPEIICLAALEAVKNQA